MHHFYIPGKISTDIVAIVDLKTVHYLRNVLRLKEGEKVQVFDETGSEYSGVITQIKSRQAVLTINSQRPLEAKRSRIAVACAVPKKSKMDDIIDKLTQLEVDIIVPLITERVVVKLEAKADLRLERWRKIAVNAAQQSRRNSLPVITPITDFKQAISQASGFDLRMIATTIEEKKAIKEIFTAYNPASVFVMVGPEGDFTDNEVKQAANAGFLSVSLGNSVLRVETAAIAIASYMRFTL